MLSKSLGVSAKIRTVPERLYMTLAERMQAMVATSRASIIPAGDAMTAWATVTFESALMLHKAVGGTPESQLSCLPQLVLSYIAHVVLTRMGH